MKGILLNTSNQYKHVMFKTKKQINKIKGK